jgi:hypothetical protein
MANPPDVKFDFRKYSKTEDFDYFFEKLDSGTNPAGIIEDPSSSFAEESSGSSQKQASRSFWRCKVTGCSASRTPSNKCLKHLIDTHADLIALFKQRFSPVFLQALENVAKGPAPKAPKSEVGYAVDPSRSGLGIQHGTLNVPPQHTAFSPVIAALTTTAVVDDVMSSQPSITQRDSTLSQETRKRVVPSEDGQALQKVATPERLLVSFAGSPAPKRLRTMDEFFAKSQNSISKVKATSPSAGVSIHDVLTSCKSSVEMMSVVIAQNRGTRERVSSHKRHLLEGLLLSEGKILYLVLQQIGLLTDKNIAQKLVLAMQRTGEVEAETQDPNVEPGRSHLRTVLIAALDAAVSAFVDSTPCTVEWLSSTCHQFVLKQTCLQPLLNGDVVGLASTPVRSVAIRTFSSYSSFSDDTPTSAPPAASSVPVMPIVEVPRTPALRMPRNCKRGLSSEIKRALQDDIGTNLLDRFHDPDYEDTEDVVEAASVTEEDPFSFVDATVHVADGTHEHEAARPLDVALFLLYLRAFVTEVMDMLPGRQLLNLQLCGLVQRWCQESTTFLRIAEDVPNEVGSAISSGITFTRAQKYVAELLRTRKRVAGTMPPGSGKTLAAVLAIAHSAAHMLEDGPAAVIVCCPRTLTKQWKRNIMSHLVGSRSLSFAVAHKFQDLLECPDRKSNRIVFFVDTATCVFNALKRCNDSQLSAMIPVRMMVVDEAHFAKSDTSNVSNNLKSLIERFASRASAKRFQLLSMTATPLTNSLKEIARFVDILVAEHAFMDMGTVADATRDAFCAEIRRLLQNNGRATLSNMMAWHRVLTCLPSVRFREHMSNEFTMGKEHILGAKDLGKLLCANTSPPIVPADNQGSSSITQIPKAGVKQVRFIHGIVQHERAVLLGIKQSLKKTKNGKYHVSEIEKEMLKQKLDAFATFLRHLWQDKDSSSSACPSTLSVVRRKVVVYHNFLSGCLHELLKSALIVAHEVFSGQSANSLPTVGWFDGNHRKSFSADQIKEGWSACHRVESRIEKKTNSVKVFESVEPRGNDILSQADLKDGSEKEIARMKESHPDVLFVSSAFEEGVDGFQHSYSTMILGFLPWTFASLEQLCCRLARRGQKAQHVDVVYLPVVFHKTPIGAANATSSSHVEENLDVVSYDYARWQYVMQKRTVADTVMDGVLNLYAFDVRAFMDALDQTVDATHMARIDVALDADDGEDEADQEETNIADVRCDDTFSGLNKRFAHFLSANLHSAIRADSKLLTRYHALYSKIRDNWNPPDEAWPAYVAAKYIAREVQHLSSTGTEEKVLIADAGCGENLFTEKLHELWGHRGNDEFKMFTVYGIDLAQLRAPNLPADSQVEFHSRACRFEDFIPRDGGFPCGSLSYTVFCLSLMCADRHEMLNAARKGLKVRGKLIIVESIRRLHLPTVAAEGEDLLAVAGRSSLSQELGKLGFELRVAQPLADEARPRFLLLCFEKLPSGTNGKVTQLTKLRWSNEDVDHPSLNEKEGDGLNALLQELDHAEKVMAEDPL